MMNTVNLKQYDSSNNYAVLDNSIKNAEDSNKMTIDKLSRRINYNNEFYTYDENILHKYIGYLKAYCIKIDCPQKYYYKPEYLAYDLYGSVDLWYLIMWFNDIPSAMDFNKPQVIVFNPSKMSVINTIISKQLKSFKRNENELVENLTLKTVHVKDKNM